MEKVRSKNDDLTSGHVQEIRIYPISSDDYPTEEYAKMCIANGFENFTSFNELGNDRGYLNLYRNSLFLFQYKGEIIAKAGVICRINSGIEYYTEEIEVFDEKITEKDIKDIWGDFKRFNSAAQIIPLKYLSEIQELFAQHRIEKNLKLNDNESFSVSWTEGKKLKYYVTKYERNPIYREQAIKIHGLTCEICGFNFETKYGRLGRDFIEVHHKKPLFSLDSEIVPNPEMDMICVCSNCHRMIHRHIGSVVETEELIELIKQQS